MANVDITVSVDDSTNPVTVSCDPANAPVGKSSKSVSINWAMATDAVSANYHVSGISGLPDTEFTDKGSQGTGWKVKDKNDNTTAYTYTVAVTHNTTRETVFHDPTITNGGRN